MLSCSSFSDEVAAESRETLQPAGRIRSEEGILSFSMSIISHLLAECNRSCVKNRENISSRLLDIVPHMW